MKNVIKEDRIKQAIDSSLNEIKSYIDVNMVVGNALKLENGFIIPVSKVTVAVLSGGGEYGKVNIFSKNDELPHTVGNGAIVSVNPCGFIVSDAATGIKILPVKEEPLEKVIEKASDIILNAINSCKNEKN